VIAVDLPILQGSHFKQRYLWQQLSFIVYKDSISIMECMWWQGSL
jgi:hypothetical protein